MTQPRSAAWRSAALTTPALAALLSAAVVLVAQWGPDWPAQDYRAWLAAHAGITAWTNGWYSGQPIVGYSVLYPVFGMVFGAAAVGFLATIAAAWAAVWMAPKTTGWRPKLYTFGVASVLAQDLLIGQVPFLLGVAFGSWAVWATLRERRWLAIALGLLCSLSSPLAGAFLLIIATALLASVGRRACWLAGSVVGIAVSATLGGAGGTYPFRLRGLLAIGLFVALTLLLTSRANRGLRMFALCYGAAAVLLFLVPNPIGGNLSRLGQLVALPLACLFIVSGRGIRRLAAVTALGLALSWPMVPSVGSAVAGANDPSQNLSYYSGLLTYLHNEQPLAGRVEIVPTRNHWESYWVARSFPIARGWERQTDLALNNVLYHPVSKQSYRHWLDQNAVAFVALPTTRIDYGGRAERKLLGHAPAYLKPVWHDSHWHVWQVGSPRPLSIGAASLVRLGSASIDLYFNQPGLAQIAVRSDRLWSITSGSGCIQSSSDGWLEVRSKNVGKVTIRARISASALLNPQSCHS